MTSFEDGLRAQALTMPVWSFDRRRIMHILGLPPWNERRKLAMLRGEQEARAQLGITDDAEVDWKQGAAAGAAGTINWTMILQIIQQILPILIQILGGL